MKHLLLILAITLMATPLLAVDPPNEIYGGLSYVDLKDGAHGTASLDFEFPVAPLLSIGPLFQYQTDRPKDGEDTTVWSMGGIAVLNMNRTHTGLYGSVGATALGADFNGWTLIPEIGVKFGDRHVAARVGVNHPFHYDVGNSPVDLEGWQVNVAIGARF